MEKFKLSLILFLAGSIMISCQQPESPNLPDVDSRPQKQQHFLNLIKEGDPFYGKKNNTAKTDADIAAFNKYVVDSLQKISNWEFIVDYIDDYRLSTSTIAPHILDLPNSKVYNLNLVAPIKPDKTIDTVAIDNAVFFIGTILKNARNANEQRILNTLKTLKHLDTVIISGSLTHLDYKSEVDFREFFETDDLWNVDLIITDLKRKPVK